jgi:hypothetical protein
MAQLQTHSCIRAMIAQFPLQDLPIAHHDEIEVLMFPEGLQSRRDHDRSSVIAAHAVQGNG